MNKQYWLVLMMGLLLTACGGIVQTPAPGLSATNTATVGLPSPPPTVAPASSPASGNLVATGTSASGGPALIATPSVVLKVKIISPEDNSVVNVPQVEVKGEVPPGTVVTLNDEVVLADARGGFSAIVPLAEGPNTIDVVASDSYGNEDNVQLTVTYDPGS